MRFEISDEPVGNDPSGFPLVFRDLPPVNLTEVRRERIWEFDHDGGLWTINGRVYDPNRIDAGIEQGSAEIWVFRNAGNSWHHPIHSHFTEHIIVEANGAPLYQGVVQESDIPTDTGTPPPPPGPLARVEQSDRKAVAQSRTSFSRRAYYFDADDLIKATGNEQGRAKFESLRVKQVKETRDAQPRGAGQDIPTNTLLESIFEQLKTGDLSRVRFRTGEQFVRFVAYLEEAKESGLYGGPVPSVDRFMGGPRRDVAVLLPGWELKVFMRWGDFLGKHVLHCHNVVHEDHAMMIRWDIMPPGKSFDGPRSSREIYGPRRDKPHVQPSPRESRQHVDDRDAPSNR